MPIARQRLGKHIPEVTVSTIEGHPLLGNWLIKTDSWQQKTVFSWGPCRVIIRGHSQKNWRSTKEYKEYRGVQRNSVGSQNSSSEVSSRKIYWRILLESLS
jgi:hypothetical protein